MSVGRPIRVLVFSWYFPPYLAAGSSRVGQLTKYLARAGADVHVVTGRPTDLPTFVDIASPAEVHYAPHYDLNALPARLLGRRSVRERGYELARLGRLSLLGKIYKQVVHFPDAQVGWLPGAGRVAASLPVPDVVLSTSSPASAHLAAALYTSRHGVPWVAEFRDPWTGNPTFERWWPARILERQIERSLARRADAVTAITATLARELSRRYDRQVSHIPNGFDPEDYPGDPPATNDEFVHVGTVYTSFDTSLFLKGVREASPVKVRFLGRNLADLRERIEAAGVGDRVSILGPRPRSEAIGTTRRSRANVLFLWRHEHPLAAGYVPQKLYEYLAAERPIIAVGDDRGDAGDILRASGLGVFVRDSGSIAKALSSPLPEARPEPAEISRYAYPEIAARFLDLFEQVIARRSVGTRLPQ